MSTVLVRRAEPLARSGVRSTGRATAPPFRLQRQAHAPDAASGREPPAVAGALCRSAPAVGVDVIVDRRSSTR
jgi:hypothetical protein